MSVLFNDRFAGATSFAKKMFMKTSSSTSRVNVRMVLFFVAILLVSCRANLLQQPDALLPALANEDSRLPQLKVVVQGRSRSIHLETFGHPSSPALFVIPGGPGADYRLLLPLKTLSDHYYVVMWDPRGAGLSERITKEEITIDSYVEEIGAIKLALVPNKKIALVGHSFGGLFAMRFTCLYPTEVERLIMIEPGAFDPSKKTGYNGGTVSFLDGQSFFWSNVVLTSSDHAAADFKAVDLLPKASRNFTCNRTIVENYPMWRFGTYQYDRLMKALRNMPDEFRWNEGIEKFQGSIDMIAGTCGAASEAFQKKYNQPDVPGAHLTLINGAGHLSLFTDYSNELLASLRNILQ